MLRQEQVNLEESVVFVGVVVQPESREMYRNPRAISGTAASRSRPAPDSARTRATTTESATASSGSSVAGLSFRAVASAAGAVSRWQRATVRGSTRATATRAATRTTTTRAITTTTSATSTSTPLNPPVLSVPPVTISRLARATRATSATAVPTRASRIRSVQTSTVSAALTSSSDSTTTSSPSTRASTRSSHGNVHQLPPAATSQTTRVLASPTLSLELQELESHVADLAAALSWSRESILSDSSDTSGSARVRRVVGRRQNSPYTFTGNQDANRNHSNPMRLIDNKRISGEYHFGRLFCAVCFGDLFKPEAKAEVTRCGHIFCANCIREVKLYDAKCPTCRMIILGRHHPVYFPLYEEV